MVGLLGTVAVVGLLLVGLVPGLAQPIIDDDSNLCSVVEPLVLPGCGVSIAGDCDIIKCTYVIVV